MRRIHTNAPPSILRYSHSLVEDIVKAACRANCEETFEEYYPDLTEAKKNAKK